MAKNIWRNFDAAGWLFWTILFVVLIAPGTYLAFKFTDKRALLALRIGSGVIVAAIGAGVISWAVNAIVQHLGKKRRLAERKLAKKRKK